jgi:hypothetical protein
MICIKYTRINKGGIGRASFNHKTQRNPEITLATGNDWKKSAICPHILNSSFLVPEQSLEDHLDTFPRRLLTLPIEDFHAQGRDHPGKDGDHANGHRRLDKGETRVGLDPTH